MTQYPYIREIENFFIIASKNDKIIDLIKTNDFFSLFTNTWHASASFTFQAITEEKYNNSVNEKVYTKKQLLDMSPQHLLYLFI